MMTSSETTLYQAGIALAQAGDITAARAKFQQVVHSDPTNEVAWLHLAGLADHPLAAHQALDVVQSLNPDNPHLAKARAWVRQTWPEANPAVETDRLEANQIGRTESLETQFLTAMAFDGERMSPKEKINSNSSGIEASEKKIDQAAQSEGLLPEKTRFVVTPWHVVWTVNLGLLVMLAALLSASGAVLETVNDWVGPLFPTPTYTVVQELDVLREAVEAARTATDQQAMIDNLEKMYALAPGDEAIAAELAELHYERGLILRNGGSFEEAQLAFNRALTFQETLAAAQLEKQHITLYLEGAASFQRGQWGEAIAAFEKIYTQSPHYPFMQEILYSAYFNQGIALQANRNWEAALEAFKQAAKVMPTLAEPREKIAQVNLLLTPPTSTPAPTATAAPSPTPDPKGEKLVVVDISDQHAYVYQGELLVYDFIVSTGEPGRDTAIGEFEIQNKIPMAYASTWNLDMPFWLGIYWSGPLQNGFHAVPTVRHTGQTMWDGYLGQRVSYGCVILSMRDAETLYNWVDVGTPVKIQW